MEAIGMRVMGYHSRSQPRNKQVGYEFYHLVIIHRSIRLCLRRMCEQEHWSLSNAILHNSVARAKHTRTHVRLYSVGLLVVNGL